MVEVFEAATEEVEEVFDEVLVDQVHEVKRDGIGEHQRGDVG
jgi:hypothetical protein